MKEKKKPAEEVTVTTEETEEPRIGNEYYSGPLKSKTDKGGNIYNITIQIGQPPLPPYKP